MKKTSLILVCILAAITFSCAGKKNDPLKNTRKLVKEGHASLYNNGAFRVPNSSIYLVPPGPETTELVLGMAGLRAKQAFLKSLKQASESVYIVSEGTKLTFKVAGKSRETGQDIADYIRKHSKEGSLLLLDRSFEKGQDLIGDSWAFSQKMKEDMDKAAEDMARNADMMAKEMSIQGTQNGKDLINGSLSFSKEFYENRTNGAKASFKHAGSSFVRGYAALPEKMKANIASAGENLDKTDFSDIVDTHQGWRKQWSGKSQNLIIETAKGYADDVTGSFGKAGDELKGCYTTGIPLASLKALRWVLQGLFWDAAIEPAGKMTAGGLGYIGVNCMAFPIVVMEEEGRALARVAVDVGWNTSKSVYQLTAPCGEAALAGVFGMVEYSAGPVVAATATTGGTVTGVATVAGSKAGSVVVKAGGHTAGKVGQYIGVPLAAAGVTTTGTVSGLAVMGGGAVGSGSFYVGGQTAALGSDVFGNIIAGTTLVTGATASAGLGASYGVYQLSKAVMVPSGYEIGAGVVLSYETMSHISAQSILAVSDCAYLVLSLEGPRWVLYAVKGNLGKDEDPVPGTVLDLKAMQAHGEEIYNLPLTDGEMKQVVSSTCRNLPVVDGDRKMSADDGK